MAAEAWVLELCVEETPEFLSCGLADGLAVTVVGMTRAVQPEYVETLEQSSVGKRDGGRSGSRRIADLDPFG